MWRKTRSRHAIPLCVGVDPNRLVLGYFNNLILHNSCFKVIYAFLIK